MTREFRISFQYQSQPYQARVLRNAQRGRVDYAVRPNAVFLARAYGRQTLIFKENGVYRCAGTLSVHNPDYVKALIEAIDDQDRPAELVDA